MPIIATTIAGCAVVFLTMAIGEGVHAEEGTVSAAMQATKQYLNLGEVAAVNIAFLLFAIFFDIVWAVVQIRKYSTIGATFTLISAPGSDDGQQDTDT